MRRWGAGVAALVLLALAGAGVARWRVGRRLRSDATGLVAKQLCSCVFVDGRDVESCRSDLPLPTADIEARVDVSAKTVRSRIPSIADRTARYRDGEGCTLY